MSILGKGIIQLLVDTSQAMKGLKDVKSRASQVGKTLRKTGAALTAGITAPVIAGVFKAVQAASDLEEATNKLEVTFGAYADVVKQALGDTVTRFGLARDAAYDAAATYGVFLKAAGLTEQQLAQLSPRLLQVAADMASFHNLRMDEALYKVRAALSGETEPLKAVGILMNDVLVKAKALEMGLVEAQVDMVKVQDITLKLEKAQRKYNEAVKQYGKDSQQAQEALIRIQKYEQQLEKALQGKVPELTEQQKILARYALLVDQARVFEGDFARTQDSVANSSRILTAAIRDLMAEFGKEFLPIAKEVLQEAIRLVKAFRDLPDPVKKSLIKLTLLAAALGPVLMGIGGVMQVAKGIGGAVSLLGKLGAIGGLIKAGWAFIAPLFGTIASAISGVVSTVGSAVSAVLGAIGPIGWVILAIIGLVTALYFAWKNNWLGLREPINQFIVFLAQAWWQASTTAEQLVFIIGYYIEQLATTLTTKAQEIWTSLVMQWERLKASTVAKFQEMVNRIRSVFSIDWSALGCSIVSGIIGGIQAMAGALISTMANLAQSALAAAKSVLGIRSPSRVFAEMGRQTVQGYLMGLREMPGFEDVMARLAPQPTVALGAGAGASGARPQVVNIHIYNPKPEAAEDSVQRALKRLAFVGG